MIKKLLAMAVALALMMVMFIPTSLAAFEMWVYTANGGALNVRATPSTGDNVIGTVQYGSNVVVDYHLGNGWTALIWGSYGTAYVQTRYLVDYQPGPRPQPQPQPSGGGSSSASAEEMTAINAEFKSARRVTPYTVQTMAARSTGTVNMRWAPHKKAELIRSYKSGVDLEVIAELKDWRQVRDPETGDVGFIRQDFLER